MTPEQYIASLPDVKTAALPLGALFMVDRVIYEVVDAGINGAFKGRQWRKDESTDVALSASSSLAQRLPVIAEGKALPLYRSRNELYVNGQTLLYAFPTEQNALEAASLDVALCGSGAGVYVRRHERLPAFEATNGATIFRQYFFMRTNQNVKTNLPDIKHTLKNTLIQHREGPIYWRLLPHWNESPYDWEPTIAMRPIILDEEVTRKANLDDTLPHRPLWGSEVTQE